MPIRCSVLQCIATVKKAAIAWPNLKSTPPACLFEKFNAKGNIKMPKLHIRTMKQQWLSIAINWAKSEGWDPGLHDAELLYKADPNGFFVGEINKKIVAVGSAVNYDAHFAFCGLYIVAPEHRGKGYGLALTKHRLKYCGERNIGIDGVLENVEIYKNTQEISKDSLAQVLDYDKQCFPANKDKVFGITTFEIG